MATLFDSLADSLVDTGYAVINQFLSQKEVDAILQSPELFNAEEKFKKAGIGKNQGFKVNEAIRGDYIQWLDKNTSSPPVRTYLDRLEELIRFTNESLFLSLKDYEVHMTVYPVGAAYKRHLDQFQKGDHRKLSVICYLNNGWNTSDGGQLRMYTGGTSVDVLPVSGRLVCFRSDQIEHEVLPATRERLSITGWLLDQHADLRNL